MLVSSSLEHTKDHRPHTGPVDVDRNFLLGTLLQIQPGIIAYETHVEKHNDTGHAALFFFFLVSLHVQLQQRRLTSHLGETTCTFYLIIFFMIDRLGIHTYTPIHLSTFTIFTTTCMYTVVQYLQGGTIRYRHSRIHTADPRRVVVGCSLPPSLPHAKKSIQTYQVPYLTSVPTSTSISPTTILLCTYTCTVHKGGREGTIMYTVSLYLDIS